MAERDMAATAPKIATALAYSYGSQVACDIMTMAINPEYTSEHVVKYLQWHNARQANTQPVGFDKWLAEVAKEETGAPSPRHTKEG